MAATFKRTFRQDLTKPLRIHYNSELVFSKDNLSNEIQIELYNGNDVYSGGGSVSGTAIRADGRTVPIENGTISGNVVTVALTEECMDVPGTLQVYVKLTSGNVKTTIFAGVFTAIRTETDTIIDPGTIIPSITELINQIDAAIDSIPADYSTLLGSVAGTYSASKTYAVGDYVWYSGQLKRCIVPITTAEAWTAAHWANAVISDDVSGLKSALNEAVDMPQSFEISQTGYIKTNSTTIDPSNPTGSTNYKHTLITVSPSEVYQIAGSILGSAAALYAVTDANYSILLKDDRFDIGYDTFTVTIPENGAYLLVNNNTNFETPNTVKKGIEITKRVKAVEDGVEEIQDELSEFGNIPSFIAEVTAIKTAIDYPEALDIDEQGYIRTNGTSIDPNDPVILYNQYKHKLIQVNPGEIYHITGRGFGETAGLYAVTTSSHDVIVKETRTDVVREFDVTIPENGAYLLVNNNTTMTEPNTVTKGTILNDRLGRITESIEDLGDEVDALKEEIGASEKIIEINDGWTNRGITLATGAFAISTKRLLNYLPYTANVCSVDNGYSFGIAAWDEENVYLGFYDGTSFQKQSYSWRTEELDVSSFHSYQLVVVVRKTIDADISLAESPHFHCSVQYDSLLQEKNVAADAYATGEAIKEAEEKAEEVKERYLGIKEIVPSSAGYLRTNTDVVDITNIGTGLPNAYYTIYPCEASDIFSVKGSDVGSVAYYCVFTDSNYTVLKRENEHSELTVIKAPENSAYVILQKNGAFNEFYSGRFIWPVVKRLEAAIENDAMPVYASDAQYISDDQLSLVANYNSLIAMYDALVARYPYYVTKNTLSSGSFTNYEYVFSMGDFNERRGERTQDPVSEKPVVLIVSGIHGHERCSMLGLYQFAKALCESQTMSEVRGEVIIKMIPIACPSGYNSNSRVNENRVNINRNFDALWRLTPDDGMNYSGAAAADQADTVVVQNWIQANLDAILYVDWHNSAFVDELNYFGVSSREDTDMKKLLKKAYFKGIHSIIGHLESDRGITGDTVIYGYTGDDTMQGSSVLYASMQGVPSVLMETSWNVADSGKDSNFTIGVNGETGCAALKAVILKLCE